PAGPDSGETPERAWISGSLARSPGMTRLDRALLRRGREGRELADVAGVVLDDYGGVEVLCDLLRPLDRGDGLRAIGIEVRYALEVVVLGEMCHVAGEDHGAHVLELHEEDVMAGRVPRRIEHHDGAVPEHILVEPHRLDLAAAADPVGEVRVIGAGSIGSSV